MEESQMIEKEERGEPPMKFNDIIDVSYKHVENLMGQKDL